MEIFQVHNAEIGNFIFEVQQATVLLSKIIQSVFHLKQINSSGYYPHTGFRCPKMNSFDDKKIRLHRYD